MDLTDFIIYLSIPLSSGLIGWGTNVLAIQMTFYPLEFKGIGILGWQGIIPSKAKKMAEKSVDMLTQKLLKIEEQVKVIQADRIIEEMQEDLEDLSQNLINEIMLSQYPRIWKNTPILLKNQVYLRFTRELPGIIRNIVEDAQANIHELLNIKLLGVEALTQNKKLLNDMFLECGREEFKFIKRSGLYFGLPFGMIQMFIAIFYTPWWLLPLFGLLVGYVTNWLALKLIFEPQEPKRYLGGKLVFQGLFIKRQSEVAAEYAKIVAQKILTSERMLEFMLRGPGADHMARIIQKSIHQVIQENIEQSSPLLNIAIGPKQLEVIKNIAVYRFQQELPLSIPLLEGYTTEAIGMEEMLRTKMRQLSSPDFVSFLRPIFQEDEWILITIGALLGMFAGILQYFVLFS